MVYRGVYREGVIVPSGDVSLREGESVEFKAASRTRKARAPRTKRTNATKAVAGVPRPRKRPSRAEALRAFKAAFGVWKDRPEWKGKTTLEIAAELRRKALGRPVRE